MNPTAKLAPALIPERFTLSMGYIQMGGER
jgi:hypothetical protein